MVFCLMVVYGLHTIHDRQQLWEDLKQKVVNTQEPFICMGHFNAVLTCADRINGNPVQEMEIRDFNEFMIDAGMTKLKAIGREYTWSNGCICSKIDRAIVNAEWIVTMNQIKISVMQPGTYDHSPLVWSWIAILEVITNFLPKVKEAWRGGHVRDLKELWFMLKKGKANLKKINMKEFIGVMNIVKEIRGKLQNIHELMRDPSAVTQNRQQEKELQIQLEKWSMIEESAMQKKSRIQWLSQRMKLNTLYKYLPGKSAEKFPSVNAMTMRNGKALNREQQLLLVARVTREEMEISFKNIHDLKALGIDGFNSFFFKKSWIVVRYTSILIVK
ncbi:hypothetical protein H5410_027375 [Solanum commersonii]|uniref:Uncharacterized protein n=1 Tax=Solanum commersonii TaxID=4109 RepID=A0A9J5YYY2_SOLCO|nr:hypothetical protein H5410_027375 [Solanum commersonii]